jgi:hypothetical protein
MNKIGLKTLEPLIPPSFLDLSALEILSQPIKKFNGFKKLTDLHLSHNSISTLEDMIGFVFLPALTHIFLEGNPIMKSILPKHLQMRRTMTESIENIDLFSFIYSEYGILIADPCFISPFKIGNELLSNEKLVKPKIGSLTGKTYKKSNRLMHKSVRVSSDHMEITHVISDLPPIKTSKIKERSKKRNYHFTDSDLEAIVKSGKVPSIKKLVEIAEGRDARSGADHIPTESSEIHLQDQLSFDPHIKDETFITGVHITGHLQPHLNDNLDHTEAEEVDESDSDEEDHSLPPNIILSVRALRQALKNPGSYWRTSKTTMAHKGTIVLLLI